MTRAGLRSRWRRGAVTGGLVGRGGDESLGVWAIVVLGLLVWGGAWLVGWNVPASTVVVLLGGVVLVDRLARRTSPGQEPDWPEPGQPLAPRWLTTDPQVRRLARDVDTASRGEDAAIRQVLRDEVCRRLVAHHGADPADPLASAPGTVHPDLLAALDRRGRLTPSAIDTLLDHLEEL